MVDSARPIVIVGGGLASARVVKAYREAGGSEGVLLLSADVSSPYHRPPLSKRYLRGEQEAEAALVEPEAFYREHEIEVRLETVVERVLPADRELALAGGERVGFERLVLASGARPRGLGVPGESPEFVLRLRTLDDSTRIRDRAREARRAIVVGAGFIGMEVTASLRALGVEVTLVHRGSSLFEAFGVPALSNSLADLYREQGVELLLEDGIAEFRGDGRLRGASTRSGRELEADLAVVGVGVEPTVEFLAGSGLELDDGVVVDERFESSVPGVFAVGDVANFYDPVFERRRRIEHWSNANYQGGQLGKALAGLDAPYDTVSTFFSEVFGRTFKLFGDPTGADELIVRGDFASGTAIAFRLKDSRLVATVLIGQDDESEALLKELLRRRPAVVDRAVLADAVRPVATAFNAASRGEGG